MVVLLKELPELGWVQAKGPILHPQNHKAQDRVLPLGLMPIISGHADNLQTILYQVQDAQVAALCLKGLAGPLRVASCMAHTTAAVTQWCVSKVSGTHPGQDTLNKASTLMLVFPAL